MRFFVLCLLFFCSCQKDTKKITLIRLSDVQENSQTLLDTPKPAEQPPYPWQERFASKLHPITKEYFRCKGSTYHMPRIVMDVSKERTRFYDCSGGHKHSLPLRDDKEYVYPILIELVNEVQRKTNMPIIISSGHRCPAHQAYIDSSPKGLGSKHLIAAEVRFYVQGLEAYPERIVQILIHYYQAHTQKEYQSFKRFEKESNVSTPPWHNKEVFIKLYKAHEGRDFDNRHPYPYISIQVRFDREKNEAVCVTQETANRLLCK